MLQGKWGKLTAPIIKIRGLSYSPRSAYKTCRAISISTSIRYTKEYAQRGRLFAALLLLIYNSPMKFGVLNGNGKCSIRAHGEKKIKIMPSATVRGQFPGIGAILDPPIYYICN